MRREYKEGIQLKTHKQKKKKKEIEEERDGEEAGRERKEHMGGVKGGDVVLECSLAGQHLRPRGSTQTVHTNLGAVGRDSDKSERKSPARPGSRQLQRRKKPAVCPCESNITIVNASYPA
ncbi:hypothetical protein Pmani_036037 [Petrolisthes manimaculis]|uniref:Uncharacterized protein n=1 Tax=Petrolisthes manimaculis TaxID=1843537 RepID=A0AAE1TMI2_9EUCA|nr:hypothetical protein Pmani_036037 [Petrolisthes manimaculis]